MNNQVQGVAQPTVVQQNKGSGKGFLIFLVIVLLLGCIGLGGYIAYDKFYIVKDESVKDASEALVEVNIDANALFQVNDTINTFEYAFNDPFSSYFGYIYSNNELKASDFDKSAAIFSILYPYLDESDNMSFVANSTVKNRFKEMFSSSINYAPTSINAGDGYFISYDQGSSYYGYQRLGKGGYFYPAYVSFYDSSKITKDPNKNSKGNTTIEVVKRVGYVEFNDTHTAVNVYNDASKGKKIGVISVVDGGYNLLEIGSKFKTSLSQYKYTFVEEGNNYVFDNVKRTK